MIIYKAINKTNGKEYIGQTTRSLGKRKSAHITAALTVGEDSYFYNALRKYGPDNFDWAVVDQCDTIEELNRLETYYIKKYDSFENGYNLNYGGGNRQMSEETKRKISEAKKGKRHSEETKRKLSELNVGKRLSEETKKNMSKAQKGRKHSEKTRKKIAETIRGSKCSEGTKRRISEANKGKRYSEATKKKMSVAKKGKGRIAKRAVVVDGKYFDTVKAAAEWVQVVPKTISDRIKKQALGYRYV